MHDLIQEIKGTVDEIREHSSSLDPHRVSMFEERYRQIIKSGIQKNPVPERLGTNLNVDEKKAVKSEKPTRPLPET